MGSCGFWCDVRAQVIDTGRDSSGAAMLFGAVWSANQFSLLQGCTQLLCLVGVDSLHLGVM